MLTIEDHRRDSAGLRYVYPVVSRRAGGVSVGINLNVNNACNWACLYCQVDTLTRGGPPPIDLKEMLMTSGNGFDAELFGNTTVNGFLKLENTTSSYLLLPPAVMDGMTDFSVAFKVQFTRFHKSGNFPTNHILTGSSSS